jgi:hypothetical protein
MKMKYILTPLLSIALWGCSNSSNQTNSLPANSSKEQTQHKTNHNEYNIELENGKKWKVVDDMLTIIRKMENDVNAHAQSPDKHVKQLVTKLQTNIDLLTSNCTMEGKAHDELHKWLLPYIDLVDALAKSTNDNDVEKNFNAIQQSFVTFNQYFQ